MDPIPAAELASRIADAARRCGVEFALQSGAVSGGFRFVKAKWWFGRTVGTYRMSYRLDESAKKVIFRESVALTTIGLAPPALIAEKSSLAGLDLSGKLSIRAPFGSGAIRYETVRELLEGIVADSGWQFVFEAGRLP